MGIPCDPDLSHTTFLPLDTIKGIDTSKFLSFKSFAGGEREKLIELETLWAVKGVLSFKLKFRFCEISSRCRFVKVRFAGALNISART